MIYCHFLSRYCYCKITQYILVTLYLFKLGARLFFFPNS